MATFVPGQPVVTNTPTVKVDPGLEPGKYRFELVVVDREGRRSAPDAAVVVVFRPG